MKKLFLMLVMIGVLGYALDSSVSVRIKDISRLENMRENQLIGYGLVVGLAGTGDGNNNQATLQGIANMLSNFGVQIDASKINGNNVAAVMVTAKIKPFNVTGDVIDVEVSSVGKAKSLRGGTLLLTPLKAANGEVYAVAQGPLSIGGYAVSNVGNMQIKNHATAGRIPNGATIEKVVNSPLMTNGELTWVLDDEDFTTIENIRQAIKTKFSDLTVKVLSASKFSIVVPDRYLGRYMDNVVQLISQINNLQVNSDMVAKIVINEKTGALVMGGPIKISPVIIAHENMNITIRNTDSISQPAPLSDGQTALVKGSVITVENKNGSEPFRTIKTENNTIEDMVSILNNIGATPQDVIAILQLMKEAGAIKGKLEII